MKISSLIIFLVFSLAYSLIGIEEGQEQKIALLFLVRKHIFHEDYWQDFLDSGRDKVSVYVHSKEGVPVSSVFKSYEIKNRVPTTWANTLKAQIELLKAALNNTSNTKFIFVSESTLPFKDATTVHGRVMSTEKSIFGYAPSPHSDPDNICYEKRNLEDIPAEYRYKNSQWVVLNRKHAQRMVEDANNYVEIISKYEADNELYPATFLASQNLLHEIEPVDLTYVNWELGGPYCFTNLHDTMQYALAYQALYTGYLFGRKFAENMDLSPLDAGLSYRKKKQSKSFLRHFGLS